MEKLTPLEQKALDALVALISEIMKSGGIFDLRKVVYYFNFAVLAVAYKCKKAPVQWSCDTLNLSRHWYSKHIKKSRD